MDWKIELIFVPVTDVDRSNDFYVKIGFNADHDHELLPKYQIMVVLSPVGVLRCRMLMFSRERRKRTASHATGS